MSGNRPSGGPGRGSRRPASVLALLALGVACRANPQCYFDDECEARFSCVGGSCVRAILAGDGGDIRPTWFGDVAPIVVARCQQCHANPPANGAPFPLVTYQDTQVSAAGVTVYERMAARTLSLDNPMPPLGQPGLTEREIYVLQRWASTGAPEGMRDFTGTTDGGALGADGGAPTGPLATASAPFLVQGGFGQIGGMAWRSNDLLFADVSNDTILRFQPPDVLEAVERPSRQTRGLAVGPNDVVFATEYQGRRVVRTRLDGAPQLVAEIYAGSRLNAPHSLAVRSVDAQVYFTDPAFGLGPRIRELDFNGLFRVDPRGFLSAEWRGTPLSGPSGLALSPDQSSLYMAEAVDGLVLRFDVDEEDGSLSAPEIFSVVGYRPSGLCVDREGNLYIATEVGVQAYTPEGRLIGVLPTPAPASEVIFGGEDKNTLFIAVGGELYAAVVGATGAL